MRSDITCVMRRHHHQLDASVGASGPHGLMSSAFSGLLKAPESPENKGISRVLLDE
jgi:hypothetical protein